MKASKQLQIDLLIIIGIFILVFLIGGCNKDKDVVPAYDIIPVVTFSSPELGYELVNVRVLFHVSVDGDSVIYPETRLRIVTWCKKEVQGRPIRYEGPAELVFWADVEFETKTNPGYWTHWSNLNSKILKQYAITLTFRVKEEGLSNSKEANIEPAMSTPEDYVPVLVWIVEQIFK